MPDGITPGGMPAEPPPAVPAPPAPVRASDADRAATVDALREEFALGRLSHETFMFRMNTAMEARLVSELPPLLEDLPPAPPRAGMLGRLREAFQRMTGRPAPAAAPAAHQDTGHQEAGHPGAEHSGTAHDGPARVSVARRLTSAIRLPEAAPLRARKEPPPPLVFPPATEGFFTIGRDSRNDLAIEDMTVSRIHARLERTLDGWQLKDLSSTNGTRVNGWRLRGQVTVRPGDVVRFGDVEYTLVQDPGDGDRGEQTHVSRR